MKFDKMFNKVFKRFKTDCYIIEYRIDTDCQDKAPTCIKCAGTGHIITRVYKTEATIDQALAADSLPNVNKNINVLGFYDKDSKTGYFKKDSCFDLSSNIGRIVLNIMNGEILNAYDVQYLQPVIVNNEVVYYISNLSKRNLNSSETIKTIETLIE